MRVLVLGLGNPILGDDGLGLRVADLVRSRLAPGSGIEVEEEHRGGLRLMERLLGCDAAVIVDAIVTGRHPPGTILRLGPGDMPTQHSASGHDVNLPTALRLGVCMGLHLPAEVRIVAVEAESILDFRDDCTAAVTAALPAAAEAVLDAVSELRGSSDRPLAQGSPRNR
jgi:hydrogenase maturation protease